MNKIELLKEIFDYYEYKYEIHSDGSVVEFNDDGGCTVYSTVEKALQEWLPTMEETNHNLFATGDVSDKYNTWSEKKINFIKNECK